MLDDADDDRDPPGDLRAVRPMKCRVCRAPAVIDVRRHNANFCADHFLQALPRPGDEGDRRLRHDRSPASGCWSRCRAARTPSRSGTSSSTSATTPTASTSGSASATTATSRAATPAAFADGAGLRRCIEVDLPRRLRLRHPDRRPGRHAGAVLGVRAVEAPPVRPGRARRRLRRRRHRPQPRRRGGGAVRQRPALADRVPRPPAAGAARPRRLPPQGQAARAAGRAGDGGLLRAPRASTTSSRSARWPRATSTSATRRRSTPSRRSRPGTKHDFYFGFLRPGRRRFAAADGRRRRPATALGPCARCGAPDAGEVCAFCRLVERAGGADAGRRHRRGSATTPTVRRRALDDPPAARAPASGCCSSTARSAATSSPWRPAASSTPTPGSSPHDDIIGRRRGRRGRARPAARPTRVVRPTLSDFVLKMPRGAQVIYPKDLGPILMLADIFPGARVLESGVGSGALSMTLLRAGADVVGYELREDFAARAAGNVGAFLGADAIGPLPRRGPRLLRRHRRDRPRPRRARPPRAVAGGEARRDRHCGPAGSSSPTRRRSCRSPSSARRLDDERLRAGRDDRGPAPRLARRGQSVRPDHRMVAHTGFLTHARLLGLTPLRRSNALDVLLVALARRGRRRRLPPRFRRPVALVDRARRRAARGRPVPARGVARTAELDQPTDAGLIAVGRPLVGGVHRPGHRPGRRQPAAAVAVRGRRSAGRRGRGAVAGVPGCCVAVWLLLPTMADVPGWPARQARGSRSPGPSATCFPPRARHPRQARAASSATTFPQVFDALAARRPTSAPPADRHPGSTGHGPSVTRPRR